MSDYRVSTGGWEGFFLVPTDLVDRHLKLASPDAIRTLLYILRNGTVCPKSGELATALGLDEAAARDALDYWVAEGILSPEQRDKAPAPKAAVVSKAVVPSTSVLSSDAVSSVALPDAGEASAPVVIKSGKMPGYSNAQIRDAFTEHPELRSLFASAEEIFAHPLSDAVINLLYGLFDWYELPVDVIVTVLRRCDAGGRLRPAAIKEEAENFYKHGAVTKESALGYAAELDERDATVNETARLLRITDHTPYARERKAFETWRYAYGYGLDVVAVALEVAQKNTDSPAYSTELLPYMQRVLTNWHKGGVTTLEEARDAASRKESSDKVGKAGGKKKKAGDDTPSYDLSAEAKRAMARFSGKDPSSDQESNVKKGTDAT